VYRPQTAVLVRPEPLLTTWVCRFQLVEVRHGVGAVGRVEEENAGLAVAMGVADNLFKELASVHRLVHLAAKAQVKRRSRFNGPHEFVGNPDRDIEVRDVTLGRLAADDLTDI